jgi:RNA polymerase sigma-70 factor (ECF subfamily)
MSSTPNKTLKPHPEQDSAAILGELVARHRDFVGFLERRLGDRAAAEDILQDAFLRSLDKLATLQDPAAAVPWFYRMLRNAVIDRRRHTAAVGRALDALATELGGEALEEEPHRQVCRCVESVVATLKPEYQAALQRIEVDGVPVKDYASEAGITSSNAGVRVFRARSALRERVHASCGACAERGCVDCTCGSTDG